MGVEIFESGIVLACSFGAEDIVLLDMLNKITAQPKVFYLDTDKHFTETYEVRDKLQEKYNIEFIQVKPALTLEEQAETYGDNLWYKDPDLCCQIRKVVPLQEILKKYDAWITGIRRDQAPSRANAKKIEWDTKFNMIKLNPIASWSSEDVWNYIKTHDLPYNPLHDKGYPSIGCAVCTRPVQQGEDARAGRWSGSMKTECGLHK